MQAEEYQCLSRLEPKLQPSECYPSVLLTEPRPTHQATLHSATLVLTSNFFSLYAIGLSCPKFTVHNALSYYSIKHSDGEDFYHVTACYSPRGKFLAGSSYHKSPAVVKALGQISQVSIIGCVVTKDTISARVSLTKKQSQLWTNENEAGQQQRRRGME